MLVQVAVVEIREHRPQGPARQTDVHHQVVGVQVGAAKFQIHDVGGTVQPLGRPKDLAAKTMGDHEVVADAEAKHEWRSSGHEHGGWVDTWMVSWMAGWPGWMDEWLYEK